METLFNGDVVNRITDLQHILHKKYLADGGMSEGVLELFRDIIYDHYRTSRRSFIWREQISPYRVVVSEVMLQQTQTDRVAKKFDSFIEAFPDFSSLAAASFEEVLRQWKGLGYNRRALALQKIAQKIIAEYEGVLPQSVEEFATFPGIGHATASSILAFAHNLPTEFIETNIRSVFIYFFFKGECSVHDKQIVPLVRATLDRSSPREWYYALMDYGVMLKKQVGNVSRMSAHYAKQSSFDGSDRQIRGMILQQLLDEPGISLPNLLGHFSSIGKEEIRVLRLLETLQKEGFIRLVEERIFLDY